MTTQCMEREAGLTRDATQPRTKATTAGDHLFIRRVIAYTLDILLLFLILAPIGFLVQWLLGLPLSQSGPALGRTILWNFSLPVWLYFVLSDWSRTGATLGKRIAQLQVKRADGARVGFWQALGRTAIKLLPWEVVHLAAFTLSTDRAPFTPGQTIGLALANLLLVVYLVVAAFTRGRRTLHDFVVGTQVQRQPMLPSPGD